MAILLDTPDRVQRTDYLGSKAVAWFAFTLTALLMASDFIDRSIIVSMLPQIKAEWLLSDTQLGGLASIVAVTVAAFSIPIAVLADRWSRVKCIFAMAFLWSLATIACGLATDYWQLLTLRGFVGVGEAGYSAVGMALLSGFFPSRMRATILAAFNAASIIGSLLGVILGGIIAKHWGWHSAFGIVGVPGLVLALLYLFVPDYKTATIGTATVGSGAGKVGVITMARTLGRTPTATLLYIANAFQLFLFSTLSTWIPSFLNRSYGLPTDQAGIRASIVLGASVIGAILWGAFADRMSRKRPSNKIRVMALSGFSSFIVLACAFNLLPPGTSQFAFIVLGGFLSAGTLGTMAATVVEVVHPGVRATAIAVGTLIQSLLGVAGGPFITGVLSDRYGLATTLGLVPVSGLLACITFLLLLRWYERDLQTAAQNAKPTTSSHDA